MKKKWMIIQFIEKRMINAILNWAWKKILILNNYRIISEKILK